MLHTALSPATTSDTTGATSISIRIFIPATFGRHAGRKTILSPDGQSVNLRRATRFVCVLGGPITYLAKFCQSSYSSTMSTMNISLPENLKSFVDEQVKNRGYGTSSEYVRELIRRDQDRLQLRKLLLSGAESPPMTVAGEDYFSRLRDRIREDSNTNANR